MPLQKTLPRLFNGASDRTLRKFSKELKAVNVLEPEISALSDKELAEKTNAFKDQLAHGKSLEDIKYESFAVVREAAKRTLGMRPFDVQILGAFALHRGMVAEMRTGEGKTLVATLPIYLNALTGKGVHLVTVNDYLAKRDAEWMGAVYKFLGLNVGVIVSNMDDDSRHEAYAADITYGTNNEIGFDYLRDNLKLSPEEMVQRGHAYAIVDEVDSILIDEARTPLIISGPAEDSSMLYIRINTLIPKFKPEHYEVDLKHKTVILTEAGQELAEKLLREKGITAKGGLYDPQNVRIVHHLNVALRAHKLFTPEKDYIVRNREVIIVDEFTGRTLEGRRFSDGLHQALEAKEGMPIQLENQTLASITFQNLFRMYDKLAGMTGTAETEATELMEIYKLPVVVVPTHKPVIRRDLNDLIYINLRDKQRAVLETVKEAHANKQPVLLGTASIEQSEVFHRLLIGAGLPHKVLSARHHEQEAKIIAEAGRPGAITIATNIAGRGTDIQLGGNLELQKQETLRRLKRGQDPDFMAKRLEESWKCDRKIVVEAGGLFVIGTERHENRRIDNQLRGRSGRQGDPGKSRFFVSMEDDLMRVFGSERTKRLLKTFGFKEGEAIEHRMISRALARAQKKVENYNFEIRKQLLKYDDVMNQQRQIVFQYRNRIMREEDLRPILEDMIEETIGGLVDNTCDPKQDVSEWDLDILSMNTERLVDPKFDVKAHLEHKKPHPEILIDDLIEHLQKRIDQKISLVGKDVFLQVIRSLILQIIDQMWKNHLAELDHLRESIGLRAYAQQDPLNEFKRESFGAFDAMLRNISDQTVQFLNLLEVEEPQPLPPS